MANDVENRLSNFQAEYNVITKGPLALMIQLTRLARSKSFPLLIFAQVICR